MDGDRILTIGGIIIFSITAIIFSLSYFNVINTNSQSIESTNSTIIQSSLSFSFKDKVDSEEYVIIDIRTPQEYNSERIKGAINIDYYSDSFEEEINKLDKNKKYLFYCRSGSRSSSALSLFEELGFQEAYELQGGIQSWVSAGYEVETCDECI